MRVESAGAGGAGAWCQRVEEEAGEHDVCEDILNCLSWSHHDVYCNV